MSHDPSMVIFETNPSDMEEAIGEIVAGGFENHPGCDLLIMRVSGAPVEFVCTGKTDACKHGYFQEADADWLRVLSKLDLDDDLKKLRSRPTLRCWTDERLHRLRNCLGN